MDWSHWHIEVSEPQQTYWLNHYPKFSHTIYKEDFEATIAVAAGATVVVRVIDGNDRQIDNGKPRRIGSRSSQAWSTIRSQARCCVST